MFVYREYLTEEFLDKKKIECVFDYNTMRGYYPQCPQQANYHDCGIFVLEYAKKFFQKPLSVEQACSLQDFKNLFDPVVVMKKRRREISNVRICSLHVMFSSPEFNYITVYSKSYGFAYSFLLTSITDHSEIA